jgi:hypothetical protein
MDGVFPFPERDWEAPWSKKLPGSTAIAAARALAHVPHARGAHRDGNVVIGFNNLGDQLRMLNVLSRFAFCADGFVTNSEANAALSFFDLHADAAYARHGVDALPAIVAGLAFRPRVARAFVPHPAVTQPLAIGIGRARALRTFAAITGEYPCGARDTTFVRCDRASWRAFYESYFAQVLQMEPVVATPRIMPRYAYAGRRGTDAVVHLSSSAKGRAMPPGAMVESLRAIAATGLRPFLTGAESERALLAPVARAARCDTLIGEPLADVALALTRARIFFGVDSSIMNLADAVGTPSIVVYNATDPRVVGPFYAPLAPIQLAPPIIHDVSILTGRLEKPPADWSGIADLVSDALCRITNSE